MAEQPLDGGIANAGQVVRVGRHVLRPSSPHSGSIHAFLRAVRDAGFEGAPWPVDIDEDGRERLGFIDGEVPVVPYPEWSQSDTTLASIARLLRGLHDAARGSTRKAAPGTRASPTRPVARSSATTTSSSRTSCSAAASPSRCSIDFEFAAPGRPVYDLAHLARFCVPIDDDVDQARLGWRSVDEPARTATGRRRLRTRRCRSDRAAHRDRRRHRPHRTEPSGRSVDVVTRTPLRCGIGPAAPNASIAGAGGGPTTTTCSPPPSFERVTLTLWP